MIYIIHYFNPSAFWEAKSHVDELEIKDANFGRQEMVLQNVRLFEILTVCENKRLAVQNCFLLRSFMHLRTRHN